MTAIAAANGVGELLRGWRQRRRLSQLDLAVEAEVSTRHLSFVETGRARPSRELVLHLAEQLDVPLRERNALLLAAGYAPLYRESALDTEKLAPVRAAIEQLLSGHEPFPALVVDRHWTIVSANRPTQAILNSAVAPALLAPPVNALRADGLAPRIVNLAEYRAHLLARLHRQVLLTGDETLAALEAELRGYPGGDEPAAQADPAALFVPLVLRASASERLTFFSTVATFGTALDITPSELAIESFFPADDMTAAAL